jgi:RNA polymerase sigma-70 factor (ECF subfamily)
MGKESQKNPLPPYVQEGEAERMLVSTEIDPELLEACRSGDRDGFRALFEMYKDKVYSIALRYSGNPATAMDITQDVFVRLFSQMANFRGESSFDTWLYRLVVNRCLDDRRKLRRIVPLIGEAIRRFHVNERVTGDLIRSETRGEVRAAIARLPDELRMAVVLRYTQGLSYDEMAAALKCAKGTVASRLSRAHKQLARRLKGLVGKEMSDV